MGDEMKIKNGRVRRLYEKALIDKIICKNMLLMAIAGLHNESLVNKTKASPYRNYRNIIAKEALQCKIPKEQITKLVETLSPDRYPSERQVLMLITLIKSKKYKYIEDYIPDSDLIYKL